MKKTFIFNAVAILGLVGILATPAFADCAEDIKKVEQQKENIGDRNEGARNAVDRLLAKAKKALSDGDMKFCAKMVSKAQNKVDLSI